MRDRLTLLQEAKALEELGGEWEAKHVAAFCGVSVDYVYRSDCPRVGKDGFRSVQGKHRLRFAPADVRAWDAKRTKRAA